MKQRILNESKNNEFILEWYPLIRIFRNNDRHFTYLSEVSWKNIVVKVAKTEESATTLRKEMRRINKERWKSISWAKILSQWDNYFVAIKYNKTVGELVDDYEKSWNQKDLEEMFSDVINWCYEISYEVMNTSNVNTARKEARKRAIKYSAMILKHTVSQRVGSIIWYQNDERRIPDISMKLIMRACMEFLKYKPGWRSTVTNHACLHLDHLYKWDENSWKYVAIDWEHSELQPYRYEHLDEAYIFQNLLHRHSESSAIAFYKEFISRRKTVLNHTQKTIRIIFIKKLLGWLFEILEDKANNPKPFDQINLHLKYMKYFLETEDISSI